MKLDKLRFVADGKKLAQFLTKWVLVLAENDSKQALGKAAYVDYYLQEFPCLREMYKPEIQSAFGTDGQHSKQLIYQI